QFVLSDATPDRFGDIVEVDSWDMENFKKNPIALFAHDKTFIIGKWANLKTTDKDLRGDLILAPKGTSPRIDEIRRLIEADILRAVSVGFRPLEQAPINAKDPWAGTRYTKCELVETSLVAVPANPNALAVAKSLNISPSTVRMVFGEHADGKIVQRDIGNGAHRGEIADKRRAASKGEDADKTRTARTGEHAESHRDVKGKPMLLSQRIQGAERHQLALQDQLDAHLEAIDDENPTEEQMVVTEDLTTKIETATRHLNNLKAIEAKNGSDAKNGNNGAIDYATVARENRAPYKVPAELIRPKKKADALDYFVRALIISAKARTEGVGVDDMRRKIYGDDEATRVVCDYVLRAASAPAMTTVTGWAAELVQTIWAAFMDPLLPMAVFPRLQGLGLALSFGQAGRIIIPTRNLTPAVSGSFVAEGAPIPVRQGMFASQTLTPKKMAVITTWTREMQDHSIPAIEGLLRQAVLEDTAIALDTVLIDNNPATAIRPAGLRSYQAGLTASTATPGYTAFIADYRALYGALLTLTNGNVRRPALIL
ncbi:MAG: phage major capsid protein, partial [Bradyrhizobiaceae bacterium]|nr:phage major capsid protein [Bradyrhizobiaceae bacterium]